MSKVEGATRAKSGQGCCFTVAEKKAWVGRTIVNKKKIKVTVCLLGKVHRYKMYFKFQEYFWSPKSSVYLLGLPICKSLLQLTGILAKRKISTWNIFTECVKHSMWPLLSERCQRFGNFSERGQIMITVTDICQVPAGLLILGTWAEGLSCPW